MLLVTVETSSSSDGVTLNNPSPVPLGATAVFTCSGAGLAIVWQPENIFNSSMGGSQAGTATSSLSVPAIEENNNTAITCVIIKMLGDDGTLQSTENLTIYG